MIELREIGRLPAAEDNCVIAVRTLDAGTAIRTGRGTHFTLSHTVLEGHRFAVRAIAEGAPLLSWGKTFGRALRDIAPGEYVCNAGVLEALNGRQLDFDDSTELAEILPAAPNFGDDCEAYQFDADRFRPAPALPRSSTEHTFMGIRRPGSRGVGTRNMIVLLGVNALVGGFVQQLERETQQLAEAYAHIDGIAAVTHTEGSRAGGNNEELLLRTLAGFLVHPNVGTVLVLDAGEMGVTNRMLLNYARQNQYALDDVLHQFVSLLGPYESDLERATRIIEGWLPRVNGMRRSAQPLGALKIALQCGGSDAFSGISGNPLAALVGKELIAAGGSAVLAETDELIGAESYVLDKVRDAQTAERFLGMVARFQERAAWHGHSAHGNPSGGNKFRGLYNIYLKSLGAAAKRHPEVRLDGAIAYGERPAGPGYYFMDSPGNDLESIAGQVASGCNLIFFVTGNGSITNFPFVPTIKIVTTSARYALMPGEMDVNAGAYLDGTPLAELAETTRDLSLAVASGQPSAGEKAGHAQVQIWRNWPRSGILSLDQIEVQPRPNGVPLPVQAPEQTAEFTFSALQSGSLAGGRLASDRVGLIVPASLCSGQIARLAAERLNVSGLGKAQAVSRFAALVHTEGCGGSVEVEFVDTMLGYLAHPLAATTLVLEHGCEISHNDFWRERMREAGLNPERVGWASVQLDGGIESTLAGIEAWFTADCARLPKPETTTAGFSAVRLGLMTDGEVDQETGAVLAALTQQITAAGGTVILPDGDPLVAHGTFPLASFEPTLAFAQRAVQPGLHLMANPATAWSETMTGLGAAGVELIVAICSTRGQQGHPFIPVLQVAHPALLPRPYHADMDILFASDGQQRVAQLLVEMSAVLSRTKTLKLSRKRAISFQITRGRLGVSL